MAGYLFLVNTEDALRQCIETGTYSTLVSNPHNGIWSGPAEGTFADFATMQPGDNVYFFINRRIYGVGVMISVDGRSRFENFPGASSPSVDSAGGDGADSRLVGDDVIHDGKSQRWVCVFKGAPHFFTSGVDMDDVLASEPKAFRILRAMWKLSFIKFDDEENQAFKNAIYKANQSALTDPKPGTNVFPEAQTAAHSRISRLVAERDYSLKANAMVLACRSGNRLRHEMALEAGLLAQLMDGGSSAQQAFGRWDYLSHQVVASPFKPVDYMDKMDVFGYRWIPGYSPTISKYLVCELKKDAASTWDVEQTMKYVDWIRDEYAHGDYSMIEAYLVAADFDPDVWQFSREVGKRSFMTQRRPARNQEWSDLRLVRYSVSDQGLTFSSGTTLDVVKV